MLLRRTSTAMRPRTSSSSPKRVAAASTLNDGSSNLRTAGFEHGLGSRRGRRRGGRRRRRQAGRRQGHAGRPDPGLPTRDRRELDAARRVRARRTGSRGGIADVDGDGDPDALLREAVSGVSIWWNQGDGTFADSRIRIGSAGVEWLEVGDLDGDGSADLVLGLHQQPKEVWFGSRSAAWGDSRSRPRPVDRRLGDFGGSPPRISTATGTWTWPKP